VFGSKYLFFVSMTLLWLCHGDDSLVALYQSDNPQFIPKAISNPPSPKYIDLERRRQLRRLAKEAAIFPNGKAPDPFTWVARGATPMIE
jgi:hypothetical protein